MRHLIVALALLACWPRLAHSEPSQLVVVTAEGWDSPEGQLQRFERAGEGWRAVGAPWPVVVGRAGMGWGVGLRAERGPGPVKAEGDGRAPAGMFSLGELWGYAEAAPPEVTLPYHPTQAADRCVDDPEHPAYNRLVQAPSGQAPWRSAEALRRRDDLYRWLITVNHNHLIDGQPPEARAGSCIFLHVWRKAGKGTAGCTAMAEADLRRLAAWLRPKASPALVQLPAAEYARLASAWGLPAATSAGPEGLVDAQALSPEIQVELKYATADNFLGRDVYQGQIDRCWLQPEAAEMLKRASGFLRARDPTLRLHVYDCARPVSVQRQMWALVEGTAQAPYVANPNRGAGSIHNYGCAVDLTLADAAGAPLEMGTAFDHFGPEAEPVRELDLRVKGRLTAAQLANRLLLREVMARAGFLPLANEWWHFNCATPKETRRRFKRL